MAAPLIIGTDLRRAGAETLAILQHRELIAIDQDPLGVQAEVVSNTAGLMVLAKLLTNGEVAVALYNSTDAQALVSASAARAGISSEAGVYLHDVWAAEGFEAKANIAAGVPAHGAVVYRARPLAATDAVAPSLSVEGKLGTLIPGLAKAATLTTRVVNHGRSAANQIAVSVQAPKGWTIKPVTAAAGPSLTADAALETRWNVLVPEATPAGQHPLTVRASFTWSAANTKAASASEVTSVVAVAPPKGATPLSTLVPISTSNGLGPVEIDASNGGEAEHDGNLISIGGKLYTRGLGTHAPSSVSYHLGGRCSSLSVDVGVDDEVGADGSVAFEVHADGKLVAQSGVLTAKDPARTLTADLKGADQLELVTLSGDAPLGDHEPRDGRHRDAEDDDGLQQHEPERIGHFAHAGAASARTFAGAASAIPSSGSCSSVAPGCPGAYCFGSLPKPWNTA